MRATLRLDPGEVRDAVTAVIAVAIAGALLGAVVPNVILGFTNSFYSGPLSIDAQEFNALLSSKDGFAVMFSSENCPSCKKMEPFWRDLADQGYSVYIIKLSADTIQIFEEYGVEGTPTFIAFREGKPVAIHKGVFQGPDVADEMKTWLETALFSDAMHEQPKETAGTSFSSVEGLAVEAQARPESIAAMLVAGIAAGVAASASPCTLPALAIYASSIGRRGYSKGFALEASLAAAVSVASVGGLALLAGSLLAAIQSVLLYSAAMMLVALGIAQLLGIEVFIPLSASLPRRPGLAGLSYGLIAGQCSLPLTAAALALAAASPVIAGAALVAGLAIGSALPVAMVTLATHKTAAAVARLEALRAPIGVVLAASGLLILLYETGAL